jgi:type IV fimbrial biogenesis protein FimT
MKGFTLLEVVIALAITAVLGVLAAPSFSTLVARERLKSTAYNLQADVSLARLESSRRGHPVHLVFQTGSQWCYALSTNPATDCHEPQAATRQGVIKVVRAADQPGISLLEASTMALSAQTGGGVNAATGQARFGAPSGQQLQVHLNPTGRASLCAAGMPVSGVAACPAANPQAG